MTATRTIAITGAAKGIGFACAERFAQAGDHVVLIDANPAVKEAAKKLSSTGGTTAIVADVLDVTAARRCVDDSFAVNGRLDVLVNSAGIVKGASILDYTIEDFDRVLGINMRGTFICSQAAARHMVKQGSGSIINMSSVNGTLAISDQVAYCASKGAVNQITRAMAIALAPHKVRVNAVAPGTIMTDLARSALSSQGAMNTIKARTPLGRAGEPSEVATVVYFLAGEDSSYITGEILHIDGGRLALNYTMPIT